MEALDYITPKKIDEAAAEAAKKAPVKKGQEQVQKASVDIFEGRNTTEYKRIAS